MSAVIQCLVVGTGVASAALAVVSKLLYTQSVAVVINRDSPDQGAVQTRTSMHWSRKAADAAFYNEMRMQLDMRRDERLSIARTVYPSLGVLAAGLGSERRYDVPAQRPNELNYEQPQAEFLTTLELFQIMRRA